MLAADDKNVFGRHINYRLTMLVNGTDGSYGQSSTVLYTNPIPYGGTCAIDPFQGDVRDEFRVICSGWVDTQGSLAYHIYGELTFITSTGTK